MTSSSAATGRCRFWRPRTSAPGDQPAPGRGNQPPQPTGWFQGRVLVEQTGDYQLKVSVPETGDELPPGRFTVVASNRELDNTRPDFNALYQFAGDVAEVTQKGDL